MCAQCIAYTQVNRQYASFSGLRGGGRCTRKAKYVDASGGAYCAQHAKVPASVMRKATGKLRDGMRPISDAH